MSYVDQIIYKLNETAPAIKALLKKIGQIDRESQKLQLQIESDRQRFLQKLQQYEESKKPKGSKELQKQYRDIAIKDKQLISLARRKVQLAEQLYNHVHEPTEKLDKQLHTRGEKLCRYGNGKQVGGMGSKNYSKKGKRKSGKISNKQQWKDDPNEPKYCYCEKTSFGEMVMCENTYCQKEWFHRECLDQKKLPEKWFCKECKEYKL